MALQQHSQEVLKAAIRWLPWNFAEAMESSDTS
jgi:hypothetical protein